MTISILLGLSFNDVRGQGYDGAGAMAGKEKGVANRLKVRFPLASFVHCFSHRLNLAVMKIIKVADVRDMFDKCRCLAEFFGNSPKRFEFFKKIMNESDINKDEQKKLINICRTRYICFFFC